MADEREGAGADPGAGAGDEGRDGAASAEHADPGSGGAAADQGQESWQEERARLLRENEELRQSQGGSGGGDKSPPNDADDHGQAAIQQRLRQTTAQLADPDLIRLVEAGDPLAKLHVQALQATAADLRVMHARMEIADYVSELEPEHRKPFRQYLKTNGNRFADLDAAFDAYEAKLLRGQRDSVTRKVKQAAAITEAHDEGRVGTAVRQVSAEENRARTMTESSFDSRVAKLEDEGRFNEARAMRRDLANARIVLT